MSLEQHIECPQRDSAVKSDESSIHNINQLAVEVHCCPKKSPDA